MINAIATLAIAASAIQPLAASYSVTDIGSLGGPGGSTAYALNNSGQVVGESYTRQHYTVTLYGSYGPIKEVRYYSHAFRWDPDTPNSAVGSIHDLGSIAKYSQAFGINNLGAVVGSLNGTGSRPCVFENGKVRELPTGTGTAYATAINDAGQVTGYSKFAADQYRIVRWDGTRLVYVTNTYQFATAAAINASGRIVGFVEPNYAYIAFRTGPGAALDLATNDLGNLGFSYAQASDINTNGTVVGTSSKTAGYPRGFIFAANGPMFELPPLPGYSGSYANAISDAGDVIGRSVLADGSSAPTIWRNRIPTNVYDLLSPGSPPKLELVDINNTGQILTRDGHLLTPQPAP